MSRIFVSVLLLVYYAKL